MKKIAHLIGLLCSAAWALTLGISSAQAQWLTQNFDLQAGWNSVFLHVDASHATIGELLATDPNASIEEIWLWKPDPSTQQFVQSPQEPTQTGSQWSAWTRIQGNASPLQRLIPNAAYLVRIRSDVPTGAYLWQLKGKPVAPYYQWSTSGLNFLGFPTVETTPPMFDSFLAQAPPEFQRVAEIFRYIGGDLGADNPGQVFALRGTAVTRGAAYWIRSGDVYNNYYGPFEVFVPSGTVQFGDTLKSVSLRLRNHSPNELTVTLNLTLSEPAPGVVTNLPVPPLLLRGDLNPTNLTYGYSNLLVGGPRSWTLKPQGQQGSETEIILGLDRSALTGMPGDQMAALLRFTDSVGQNQIDVGLAAKVGANAGLWVGAAAITDVGQYLKSYSRDAANNPILSTNGATYISTGTNTSLGSVPAPYPLRLIVHNPTNGPASLFQHLFVGFNGASNAIIANREAALNRSLLRQSKRLSAAHLPFSTDNQGWNFGAPLQQGATVTVSITNRFDNHSSNPFLHTYHPDHDNLDARFQKEVPQGSESYTIVRDITLRIDPPADDFNSRVSAAQSMGGEYGETIRMIGLARAGGNFDTRTFQTQGIFTLNRISEIPTITPP